MDPTPVIFKRPKGKQTQRSRQISPDSAKDDNAQTTGDDSPSTLAAKVKKRAKPKTRLSFGGDVDEESGGEAFKVKKSSLSRKMGLGTHPASISLNFDKANISPNRGPTYDQAYLNELKASTPTTRPSGTNPYDTDISMNVDDVVTMSVDDPTPFSEAIIPTESSIKLTKEKRDRLRKVGASTEDDFISLSVVRKGDEYQGPHPESRLVREEDEIGEGDDEFAEYTSAQERIALGNKSRKVEATKRRDEMKELIADAEEEDEETVEWEREQLRRGGHLASQVSTPPKIKQVYKPAPIPTATQIPNLSSAMARLTEQLTSLTTSHANNTDALNSLAKERAEVADREAEMRDMVGRAEEKRAWFESFKDWLEGVAGFLDEKYPILEKLEEEHLSLLQERFEMINARRRSEDEDDLSTIFGPRPNTPSAPEVGETDELGRVVPKPNPAVIQRQRRDARTRRRQRRLEQRSSNDKTMDDEEEGYSTDSSLPPHDESAYEVAIKSLKGRMKDVLADVRAEEFIDPGKGRWGVWRERYSDSYVGAWGGLGVVSVWEFWVRLEMVAWDCLESPRAMDTFKWYQGLYTYSRPGEGEDECEHQLGPDGDLVASMITTAVLPRLSVIITGGAFDPYSEMHIKRAVHLAEEVEASVEENTKLQVLLKAVVTCFQAAINKTEELLEEFSAVRQRAPAFDPEAIPARRRFLARRIKLLRNFLRWRKYTGERFGIGALITRVVENCVLEVAESGWEVGGESFTRTVATMLPEELIPSRLKLRLRTRR